jgi:hypothetical protein
MSDTIFQFKVTLKEIQPPIWRRFQVRSDITFRDLHNTLQVVMGWWDTHLHLFQFKGNIQRGDLILRGECVRCGGVVVRLLEGG